jgi:hypothetical protein
MNRSITWAATLLAFLLAPWALASDFDLSWFTADGGGGYSAAGDFELEGTIGQPDASTVLTGGDFELTGGFWGLPPCWCLADLNNDGLRNGDDVQGFIDCLTATGVNCACADLVTDGLLDMADVTAFVDGLLAGTACQ